MLQGLAEDDWILDPAAAPALEAMIAHDLRFDALVFTRHLKHIATLAARYPALRIVIDHGAKPPIAARALDPWRAEMAAVAQFPNVSCKLSGLLTEASPGDGAEALAARFSNLLSCFGPSRVMWGSDWPVLNLALDYSGWLAMAQRPVRQFVGRGPSACLWRRGARVLSVMSAPQLSSVGLGGAGIGNLYRAVTDDIAHATVHAALEAGYGLVDTAPYYGHGLSEMRIGAALKTWRGARPLLSSKVGRVA